MSLDQKNGRAAGDGGGAPEGQAHGMDGIGGPGGATSGANRKPLFRPELLEEYRHTAHELIPLHVPNALNQKGRPIGKAPYKGWRRDAALTVDEAVSHMAEGGNVGVRLRPCDLVVDVDPRNFVEGDDPFVRLGQDLGIDWSDYPKVVTGSGGFHIYMLKPEYEQLRDSIEAYQGVEFKTLGRQVVSAGSVHPDTGRAYCWDDDPLAVGLDEVGDAPHTLIELTRRSERVSAVDAGDRTPEQLGEMLEGLDPTRFRDHGKWLELMMAAHHATAGGGRDEWIEWSTADPQYARDAWIIGRRWDSLDANRGGPRITEKTLFKALIDTDRSDLLPRESAQDDFRGDPPEVPEGAFISQPDQARVGLASEWVWVAGIMRFVRRSDTMKYSDKQFQSMYQDRWTGRGNICSAVWDGKLPIKRVEALAYVPSEPEFIDHGECAGRYNLWRPSGVFAKPGDVSIFLEHMAYMFPDETERGYVLDYLSLLVSERFVKIHFALLVRGRQGTGKSFIGKLVRAMIGNRNVSMPSSTEVTKEFTGWQEGVQLAVLEEMMAIGRKEVANRLKPVVTDDYLRIRIMHTDAYSTPNYLNLLCFTNHSDALPIEPDDRRWLVVFSDVQRRDGDYYSRLFGLLEGDGPAAVKHYLQARKIGLNPKDVAPRTVGKDEMRRRSLGDVENYLSEKLEEEAGIFAFDLVRSDDVWDFVKSDFRGTNDLRGRVVEWLKATGAVQHTAFKKQDGNGRPGYRLWSLRNHDSWADAGAAKRIDAWLGHHCVAPR